MISCLVGGDRDLAGRRELVVFERGVAQFGRFLFGIRHGVVSCWVARRGRVDGRPAIIAEVRDRRDDRMFPGSPAGRATPHNRPRTMRLTLGEFELIERFFTRPARRAALGVGDDCALLAPSPGMTLAVSSDMLIEGRHFLSTVAPDRLGHKALAVNLSDSFRDSRRRRQSLPRRHWPSPGRRSWSALRTASD